MSMMLRLGLATLAALIVSGCASPVYSTRPAGSPASQPAPVDPAGESAALPAEPAPADSPTGRGAELPPASPPVSIVAASLVVTSRDQRSAGNLNGAAATIERGLTIAPDEAVLWIELAEIRLAQGDETTAREMARKALTLTNDGTPVADRADRILRR